MCLCVYARISVGSFEVAEVGSKTPGASIAHYRIIAARGPRVPEGHGEDGEIPRRACDRCEIIGPLVGVRMGLCRGPEVARLPRCTKRSPGSAYADRKFKPGFGVTSE